MAVCVLDCLAQRASQFSVHAGKLGDISGTVDACQMNDRIGLHNQRLAINGVFHAGDRSDAVAVAIEALGQQALKDMPTSLQALPQDMIPLRAIDTVGLPALRALLSTE